ncbi:hypothetical protein [Providencia rettgeri]|uniref:hypothetical protein n=1 Tax=Providencia rettgeri TaxID=587 RepID=UPI001F039D3E|nr:hypothetical protein [Providencia rettgeri]MCG9940531.1 hypothetical protein [Providencia rettgeri]
MELFIVIGVVVVIIYLINQNKTKVSDRTVVTHTKKIQTEDGEINIHRTQVVEQTATQFSSKPDVSTFHNQAVQSADSVKAIQNTQPQKSYSIPEKQPVVINQQPIKQIAAQPQKSQPSVSNDNNQAIGKKQCTRCRINLPYDKFRKSSKNPDGHTIWCASCLDGPKNTKHMKWCPVCNVRRKRTSFYPNNQNADKLMAWCKTCWDKHKAKR